MTQTDMLVAIMLATLDCGACQAGHFPCATHKEDLRNVRDRLRIGG